MQTHLNLKSLILAAGLVLSAAAPAVFAMPHAEGGRGGMPGAQWMHALDDVGATEAQRQQIRDIMRSAHEELRTQREQGQALHKQMLAAFAAPNVDANAVEALRRQELALHDARSQRMSRAMIEAARVLTPEQRAQLTQKLGKRLESMQERMKERMHDRKEERKGPHGRPA
ncbi:Spy/CpxP family protein refolding chaperone [Inhella inkyongensis]|uniref:Spy/CpxP family protein refolding chaperone n=1 Tax=Inhella inkyongensis TaxID=392593 RepID=A0A840S9W5_9BURK|nr:Spy/CpxP family protein refolding chaperone [Inhella inkyongensis]MBB5206422.1 Spy/CpxP family protein refolding chaperone [Inhella inkyongensis]